MVRPARSKHGLNPTLNADLTADREQRQKYTIAGIRTTKEMASIVHVELDENDMITRFEDRWCDSLLS